MGTITDVAQAGVIDKVEIRLAVEPELLWMDTVGIASFVRSYYYKYFAEIQHLDLAWSDEIATIAIRIQHDIVGPILENLKWSMESKLEGMLHLQGNFWNFITQELGISYNTQSSSYKLIEGGFIDDIGNRVRILEAKADPFTQTEMSQLEWLLDHYEDFQKLAEDDIEYVINEVMNKIEPEIAEQVTRLVRPFDNRLSVVEETLNKTQFWFWDLILDVWAFLAGGSVIPIDQIENAMVTIGEWFIDEIYEITDPMKDDIEEIYFALGSHLVTHDSEIQKVVLRELNKIDTLSTGQIVLVNAMITTAIAGIIGGGGVPGPPGPPGPPGAVGPAGPPGEPGEGTASDIDEINSDLHDRLNNAGAITTGTVTGVVDWMLYTYGLRFADLQEQIVPITEFFTDEMKTDLTGLVDKFGSPEAIISFLIPDSEGQETEVLELMQVLIALTFERGL